MSLKFIMPEQGQNWRHYKGGYQSLYTIVGVGPDHDGVPTVAYTPYNYMAPNDAPIYFQPLGRFLQDIEVPIIAPASNQKTERVPRFRFDREYDPGDRCRYIGPRPTANEDGRIATCISMLASVVKSGGAWDDTLEKAKDDAMFLLAQR